ncbi:hypothetical protein Tco_1228562 [Tanacetum coccineum]
MTMSSRKPPYMLEDPYAEAALQAPPSPDYVPGPEEPEQAPPSPDYVPGPEHDDDEIVDGRPAYAQRHALTYYSFTTDMRIGWTIMDIEADEEDEEMRLDVELDEEERREHLAPAYPVVVALPATLRTLTTEETEPFETDFPAATPPPSPCIPYTARITNSRALSVPLACIDSTYHLVLFESLAIEPATIRMKLRLATLPIPTITTTLHNSPPPRPDAPPNIAYIAPTSFPPLSLNPLTVRREAEPSNLPPSDCGRMRLYCPLGYKDRRDPEKYVGYGITIQVGIVETLQGTLQKQAGLGMATIAMVQDQGPAYNSRRCSLTPILEMQTFGQQGTEGDVDSTLWFEKRNCCSALAMPTTPIQIRYTSCTLQDDALTWWNALS